MTADENESRSRRLDVYCDGGSTHFGPPRHEEVDLTFLVNYFGRHVDERGVSTEFEQWGPLISEHAKIEWPNGVKQLAVLQGWPPEAPADRHAYASFGSERVKITCPACPPKAPRSLVFGDSLGHGWDLRHGTRDFARALEKRRSTNAKLSRVADSGVSRLSLSTLERLLAL